MDIERLRACRRVGGLCMQREDSTVNLTVDFPLKSRCLLVPAEALNVLTVGALHADQANPPVVLGRHDFFAAGGLSPLSRVGHGFRRADGKNSVCSLCFS